MKIRVGRTGLAVMMILSAGFVIFIFAGALNSDRAPETTKQ